MRTDKEVQEWLKNNPIEESEINSITKWLQAQGYENMLLNSSSDGRRIGDVIEFVYSEKVEVDTTKIQKQLVKINKEINKLQKLINEL